MTFEEILPGMQSNPERPCSQAWTPVEQSARLRHCFPGVGRRTPPLPSAGSLLLLLRLLEPLAACQCPSYSMGRPLSR